MNLETIKKNRRKPKKFLRQDAHKVKCLKKIWRRPRGMHNKMRWGLKGHRIRPTIGYKLDDRFRGLIGNLRPVLILNLQGVKNIKEGEGVIVSRKVGMKNKLIILEEIKKLKLKCLNLDVEKTLAKLNAEFSKRKEGKKIEKKEEKKALEKTEEKPLGKMEEKKEEVKTEEKKEEIKKEIKEEKKETKKEHKKVK